MLQYALDRAHHQQDDACDVAHLPYDLVVDAHDGRSGGVDDNAAEDRQGAARLESKPTIMRDIGSVHDELEGAGRPDAGVLREDLAPLTELGENASGSWADASSAAETTLRGIGIHFSQSY